MPAAMRGHAMKDKMILVGLSAFYLSACGTAGGDRALFGGLAGGNAGAVIGSFYGEASKGALIGVLAGAAAGAASASKH